MRIDFSGRLEDAPEIRAGFIGCGSHSFRNIYPTFQFAPVNLVAVCDLELDRAQAFAAKFGASNAYADYHQMLDAEELDAVFIVTGYDAKGRPQYPKLTVDCLNAGCHVWIEKPPAATCREIDIMQNAERKNNKNVLVGMKKMFFPANEKAKELMEQNDFGGTSQLLLQYPQYVPTIEEFQSYQQKGEPLTVVSFLDHLCHPISLMVYLLGMPETVYYERSDAGSGSAVFHFPSGAIASLALTFGASRNGAMERTTIISDTGRHITVENNTKVTYHQIPPIPYGRSASFFLGSTDQANAVWEPEFSLGQLYNKGLFLLGYYNEVNEFARSILENRRPAKGTLKQARQVTRIFEAFTEGPGKLVTALA